MKELPLQVRQGHCFVWDPVILNWSVMKKDEAISAELAGGVVIIKCTYCMKPAMQLDLYFPPGNELTMCKGCMIKHSRIDSGDFR
jgi:hypothetical protein